MQKILLVLLPFWPPLIPPMGISCLKSFLNKHGWEVKTVDANVKEEFRKIYDNYFDTLKEFVPGDKRGNFYNIGIDVLHDHMTAAIHYPDEYEGETQYIELIKRLVEQTFFCEPAQHQVRKLDNIVTEFYEKLEGYFMDLLEKEMPGVLGISIYKGTFGPSLFAFRLAKRRYPNILTVMGGGIFSDQLAVGSANFEFFLEKTPYIDKIIVGEGELLFLKLLRGQLPSSRRVFTRQDRDVEILDMKSVDIPDFSDFELEYYSQLAAYTSRSCPFQCGFCAETVNWGKYRKKSAKQVVKELNQLYKTYGSQLFLMSDSLLNPIANDLAKELADSDVALYWDGYIRADKDVCDVENTLLWRRGGFYRARLGIESGSERVLNLMNKGLTPQQIKSALFSLSHAGIKTSTYWVIGYPGETEEDFLATLDMLEELKDHIYEAECNPFRYYLIGQVKSGEWAENNRVLRLHPETTKDQLIIETWMLDGPGPSREETYRRVSRFVRHCEKLGIPNPYSWQEIYKADERWKKLHTNAVPPLIQFKSGSNYIDECKHVESLLLLQNVGEDEGDFNF